MSAYEKVYTNRRRSDRASVLLAASVVTMSAYQYFELVNLSATGAKLRGPSTPSVGKSALLRLDGFQVLCKVVWVKNDLCGVHFEELIPPRVLAHFRKVGSTAQLGMLTPDEQQAAEEWANGAGS
jgi:hypothetical protein